MGRAVHRVVYAESCFQLQDMIFVTYRGVVVCPVCDMRLWLVGSVFNTLREMNSLGA